MTSSLEEAVQEAEAILLLVRHTPFRELSPEALAGLTSTRVVIDTVNAWDAETWSEAGFELVRLGAGK